MECAAVRPLLSSHENSMYAGVHCGDCIVGRVPTIAQSQLGSVICLVMIKHLDTAAAVLLEGAQRTAVIVVRIDGAHR